VSDVRAFRMRNGCQCGAHLTGDLGRPVASHVTAGRYVVHYRCACGHENVVHRILTSRRPTPRFY